MGPGVWTGLSVGPAMMSRRHGCILEVKLRKPAAKVGEVVFANKVS